MTDEQHTQPEQTKTNDRKPFDLLHKLRGHKVFIIFMDGKTAEGNFLTYSPYEILLQPFVVGAPPVLLFKHAIKSIAPKDGNPWKQEKLPEGTNEKKNNPQ